MYWYAIGKARKSTIGMPFISDGVSAEMSRYLRLTNLQNVVRAAGVPTLLSSNCSEAGLQKDHVPPILTWFVLIERRVVA